MVTLGYRKKVEVVVVGGMAWQHVEEQRAPSGNNITAIPGNLMEIRLLYGVLFWNE